MKEEKKEIYNVVIASLLHDIGKFMQRAEVSLSAQSKGMEGIICPVHKGNYSHKHVLWTNEFFENYAVNFPEELDKSYIANLASFHHSPDDPVKTIIAVADRLSSGMERLEKDYDDEMGSGYKYKKERLLSLFEMISLEGNNKKIGRYKYNLKHFLPEKEIFFPVKRENLEPGDGELLTGEYGSLWDEFVLKFNEMRTDSVEQFISSLLSILEFYMWCIPSSTVDTPDISLYDHGKTTAAIAACLYEYHRLTDTLNLASVKNNDIPKFRLVGGDLSGIQKYIFDLSEGGVRGAGRILRARSFYIQIVERVAAHYLLHSINMPLVNVIMEAGGKFVLLVPNTESIQGTLESVYEDLCRYMMHRFNGELTINVNWDTEIKGTDFNMEIFPDIIKDFERKTEAVKSRKLIPVLSKEKHWNESNFILGEQYDKYDEQCCSICKKNPIEKDNLCSECDKQIEIGRWLSSAHFLAFSKHKPDDNKHIDLIDGKYFVSLLPAEPGKPGDYYLVEKMYVDERDLHFKYPLRFMANYVPHLNAEDIEKICPLCEGYKSDECKKEIGHPKTFTCIAAKSKRKTNEKKVKGAPLLGFLKADIDRLGFIFGYGFGNKLSISRYASLSRMLDVFFTGYLGTIMRTDERFSNTYTVFAGGDDLFLISDWETSIFLAEKIYNEFRQFSCNNDDITLSCGIDINRARYPVRMASRNAEANLEKAKNNGRDSVSFFNTTVKWKDFEHIKDFARFLKESPDNEKSKIKTGFIHRLLKYHKMAENAFKEKDADVDSLIFHALMNYDIRRNIVELDKNKNIKNIEEVKELLKLYDLGKRDKTLMLNLKIPIFWSLYFNRGGQQNG